MMTSHGSSVEDSELLQQLVTQELKSRNIEIKLETPKPSKKSFVPFSTPSNTPHGNAALLAGRIFGRRLSDLSKLLVSLEDSQNTDVLVPKLLVSGCKYIEDNVGIEGLYRLSGSAARQKVMRKEMDCHGDFSSLSVRPSVLDVAALLKQFLRELPQPVVPRIYHSLLASAFSSGERLQNMTLCLLLLPQDHLASLSFLMRHLSKVAQSSNVNKMTATNLAIVLSPNLLPVQDSLSLPSHAQTKVDKKTVELNNKKLKLHTDILEWMITHSDSVGYVDAVIMERYNSRLSLQSYYATSHSEDNLDDDISGPSRRKTKKKHIRRRSGSLSRVLSSMGKSLKKAMGQESPSVHSTPLPVIINTPDNLSPRGTNGKRKATMEHEMSPTNKVQKRAIESTFTPKMRGRTFSVKRFKRRKSEGKFKPVHIKETATSNEVKSTPRGKKYVKTPVCPSNSSPERNKIQTRSSLGVTPNTTREILDCSMKTNEDISEGQDNFEEEYAEVKAQYEELRRDISLLERSGPLDEVTEKFEAACAAGQLARETRETARQMARVRRSSSTERKPRSPSQRRIGVIRRRSREREQRSSDSTDIPATDSGPAYKPPLTPLNLNKPGFKSRLQRGQPNSRSVGLEKPLPSPVLETTNGGKTRIKMSFKEREKPVVRVANRTPTRQREDSEEKTLTHGDSLASLKNDISDMIEKSFGSEKNEEKNNDDVFNNDLDERDGEKNEMAELSSQIENISFKAKSPGAGVDDFFVQSSPVTRSQLRRVSDCFEFARPDDPVQKVEPGNLRRQSSAFEFRSSSADPSYQNLTRDVATRQSLRRRNSSVRDLVQKIETETRKRSGSGAASDLARHRYVGSVSEDLRSPPNKPSNPTTKPLTKPPTRPVPEIRVEANRLNIKPLRISEDDDEFNGGWVDASEFFKNVTQVEAPQCGRSSIVKIRKEIKGRVQDSVSKFSHGNTPARPAGASRRLSARMGTISVTNQAATPLPRPAGTGNNKQTLTGIRTTAGLPSKRLSTFANPTIASSNKVRDKSPIYENQIKPSKTGEHSYQNVMVERNNSNSRDLKRVPVERSGSRGRKPRVRRNRSDTERKESRRAGERRHLTITGLPGEGARSPLKERQNIPANVRRSESDRTPSRHKNGEIMTRSRLRERELENMENININVVRKHSLKSDVLMSPQLPQTRFQSPRQVKRAASERSTPKTAPYSRTIRNTPVMTLSDHRQMNMELMKSVTTADTPRRSPRFSKPTRFKAKAKVRKTVSSHTLEKDDQKKLAGPREALALEVLHMMFLKEVAKESNFSAFQKKKKVVDNSDLKNAVAITMKKCFEDSDSDSDSSQSQE